MEWWNGGILEWWNGGMVERWNAWNARFCLPSASIVTSRNDRSSRSRQTSRRSGETRSLATSATTHASTAEVWRLQLRRPQGLISQVYDQGPCHHSIILVFQHSTVPAFHRSKHSNIPPFPRSRRSIIPSFPCVHRPPPDTAGRPPRPARRTVRFPGGHCGRPRGCT